MIDVIFESDFQSQSKINKFPDREAGGRLLDVSFKLKLIMIFLAGLTHWLVETRLWKVMQGP